MTEAYMQRAATRIGASLTEYRSHIESSEKWCFKHRAWHPRESFQKQSARPDGLHPECRAAVNARTRAAMKRLYWRRKEAAGSSR